MSNYKEVPSGFDFNTEFNTWILAFCPDTLEWFATNQRFFYYEYPMEFENETDAVDYFIKNASKFYELEEKMVEHMPTFAKNKLWLSNIQSPIELN